MRVLAIETSGRVGSVALLESDESKPTVAVERRTPEGQRTAQCLLPVVHELLCEHAWRPADVDLVCVTTGPGSFTGLRIGVVAAKTLAYAIGARLVGVHTLTALAAGFETPGGDGRWAVLDAQRQELFAAAFAGKPPVDQALPETLILPIEQWLQRLQPGDVVAGPPLSKLRPRLPSGIAVADESLWQPSALAVARLGVQLLERGAADDPLALLPHYYRKSAAEEKAASLSPRSVTGG